MKKINLIIFFLSIAFTRFGVAKDCPNPDERTISGLEKTISSCKIQKEFAKDQTVKDNHQKLIYDKLAKKLALQIKQNSEEFSLLTNYYNASGKDLMSKDVGSQCKLEKFKKIENCSDKPLGSLQKDEVQNKFHEDKIKFLKKYLPSNESTPFNEDKSLYGVVAGKFYLDMGLKAIKNTLQCPLDSSTSTFSLQAQLDNISAESILAKIGNDKFSGNDELFNEYPQLKLIKNSNDPALMASFRNEMKNKPVNILAKDHIAAFFFKESNQKILSETLAKQCSKMNDDLYKFVCTDLKELGSLDDNISRDLFNKLGTSKPLEEQGNVDIAKPGVLTAYGMQCLAKDKNQAPEVNIHEKDSVDDWYSTFTYQLREEGKSKAKDKSNADQFCSIYTCQKESLSDEVFEVLKQTNSCKRGGPITSEDLETVLKCKSNPLGEQCTSQILKASTLLKNIEKLKNDSIDKLNINSSKQFEKIEERKSGGLPAFAENFFGAEGTLKALGKEVTPTLLAEKRKDIEEKTTTSSPASASLASSTAPASTPSKTPPAPTPQDAPAPTTAEAPSSEIRPDYNPTQRAAVANTQKLSAGTKSTSESKTFAVQPTSSDSKESSRLRSEMEAMLKDLKNNPIAAGQEENASSPTAASDNNKPKSATTSLASIANRAEEERLRRWENSLKDESRSLDDYRRDLDNRARSGSSSDSPDDAASRSAASKAMSGANADGASAGTSSGSSSSGATGSSALKLSATNAKGEQKTDTAAILQSGKETSTLTVEELSTLSPDNLKRLGIDSSKPFTLRVNFKEKTYEVPVKSLLYKGNNILGPVIDPKNKDLKDFLMKSPLFKSYRDFRMERGSLIDI
jgi:hypothetical protein